MTMSQILAVLMVLQAFGVDQVTLNKVHDILIPPVVQVAQTTNQAVVPQTQNPTPQNQQAAPTLGAVTQPATPVCDDTPTITYNPWMIQFGGDDNGKITEGVQTLIAATSTRYNLLYTVSASSCQNPKGWLIDIIYPSKAQGNPQGDVRFSNNHPSKDMDFFGDAMPGAFYTYTPGIFTTTFVAHDGTTFGTTTTTITAI